MEAMLNEFGMVLGGAEVSCLELGLVSSKGQFLEGPRLVSIIRMPNNTLLPANEKEQRRPSEYSVRVLAA